MGVGVEVEGSTKNKTGLDIVCSEFYYNRRLSTLLFNFKLIEVDIYNFSQYMQKIGINGSSLTILSQYTRKQKPGLRLAQSKYH